MAYWFTADLHFDHTNVIKYAKRPFLKENGEPDVNLMNEQLIERWNSRVQTNDEVYILGDVSCATTPDRAINLVTRLVGRKYLIFGNHDKALRKNARFLENFIWARDFAEIKLWDPSPKNPKYAQPIVLCHYAMRVWNKSHYGAWQLYGHSHGSLKDEPHLRQLDVGVDNWSYAPVSYEELKQKMAEKTWKPIDHHGAPRDI